jgi:hypothetical protein
MGSYKNVLEDFRSCLGNWKRDLMRAGLEERRCGVVLCPAVPSQKGQEQTRKARVRDRFEDCLLRHHVTDNDRFFVRCHARRGRVWRSGAFRCIKSCYPLGFRYFHAVVIFPLAGVHYPRASQSNSRDASHRRQSCLKRAEIPLDTGSDEPDSQ